MSAGTAVNPECLIRCIFRVELGDAFWFLEASGDFIVSSRHFKSEKRILKLNSEIQMVKKICVVGSFI